MIYSMNLILTHSDCPGIMTVKMTVVVYEILFMQSNAEAVIKLTD